MLRRFYQSVMLSQVMLSLFGLKLPILHVMRYTEATVKVAVSNVFTAGVQRVLSTKLEKLEKKRIIRSNQ